MTGNEIVALILLLVGGFLIGGVVSFWRTNKLASGVLAILAAIAVAAAVLRLLPTGV